MERYNINYTYDEKLLNLYNKPLKKCKSNTSMSNGSWDEKGKCSEKDGGVHQICIKNISKNNGIDHNLNIVLSILNIKNTLILFFSPGYSLVCSNISKD